jgi:hypothetical protein
MLQAIVVVLLVLMSLAGCSENYRYPCQDPDNWEKKECQKPYCSANGTCPEDLTPYDKDKVNGQVGNSLAPQQAPRKGDCK